MEPAGTISVDDSRDGVSIVTITGEHDLDTAAALATALTGALESGALVLDLGGATFVDSSILGVILEARRAAGEDGNGFAVALEQGSDAVTRVLELTGLLEELPVHASRAEALAAAQPPAP